MIYLLIVLALILGTLLSVLFLKAKVIIEYDGVKLRIKFRSGLIRISIDSDSIEKLSQKFGKKEKTDGADPNTTKAAECGEVEPHRRFFDKVEKIKLKYLEIRTVVDIFLRCIRYRVDFSEIYVKVRYGTGDAPSTGVLYGAVWALIGNLYSFLCRYFTIAFPQHPAPQIARFRPGAQPQVHGRESGGPRGSGHRSQSPTSCPCSLEKPLSCAQPSWRQE